MYKKAAHHAIDFINNDLDGYPYSEVRLFEIPYYQDSFNAFANSIAISEKEGWYADTDGMKERAYIFQSTASQMIKHWLQSKANIANVQGGNMLSKALPEALALQLLKEKLGKDALAHIIQRKKDFYGKEKNNEANTEPPLLYADGIEYLEENKGVIVFHEIIEHIGDKSFIKLLNRYLKEYHNKNISFEGFYTQLKPLLSSALIQKIEKV